METFSYPFCHSRLRNYFFNIGLLHHWFFSFVKSFLDPLKYLLSVAIVDLVSGQRKPPTLVSYTCSLTRQIHTREADILALHRKRFSTWASVLYLSGSSFIQAIKFWDARRTCLILTPSSLILLSFQNVYTQFKTSLSKSFENDGHMFCFSTLLAEDKRTLWSSYSIDEHLFSV